MKTILGFFVVATLMIGIGAATLSHGAGEERPRDVRFPEVYGVSISTDSKQALSVSGDVLTLWSLPKCEIIRKYEPMPGRSLVGNLETGADLDLSRTIGQLAVAWKHDVAVTADQAGTVRVWSISSGKLLNTISTLPPKQSKWLYTLALSPDGRLIYTSTPEKDEPACVRVWDRETGKLLRRLARRDGFGVGSNYIRILPATGAPHALLASFGNLALWDLENDKALWEVQDAKGRALDATSDCKIICYHLDKKLIIRGPKGELLRTRVTGYEHATVLALIGPDGRRALGGGWGRELALWNLEPADGPALVARLKSSRDETIMSIAVSSDGKLALTGSTNDVLQLWDLERGAVMKVLTAGPKRKPRDPK